MTSIIAAITAVLGKVLTDAIIQILYTKKKEINIQYSEGDYITKPNDLAYSLDWLLDEDRN